MFGSTCCKTPPNDIMSHSGIESKCRICCCSNIPSHKCCWTSKVYARRDNFCKHGGHQCRDSNLHRRCTIFGDRKRSSRIDWPGRIHLWCTSCFPMQYTQNCHIAPGVFFLLHLLLHLLLHPLPPLHRWHWYWGWRIWSAVFWMC